MVMGNLHILLQDYNTSDPLWFGCQYKYEYRSLKNGYPQGGAGYVLSKAALEKIVNEVRSGYLLYVSSRLFFFEPLK